MFITHQNFLKSGLTFLWRRNRLSVKLKHHKSLHIFTLWPKYLQIFSKFRSAVYEKLRLQKKNNNNWLTDWRTDWTTDWLTDWLNDWLTDWMNDGLTYWLTDDWLTDLWTDWWTYWLHDGLTDWMTDWLNNGLTDLIIWVLFLPCIYHLYFERDLLTLLTIRLFASILDTFWEGRPIQVDLMPGSVATIHNSWYPVV